MFLRGGPLCNDQLEEEQRCKVIHTIITAFYQANILISVLLSGKRRNNEKE